MNAVHAAAAALLLLAAIPMLPTAAADHVCADALAGIACASMEQAGACNGTTSDSSWDVGAWTFGGGYLGVGGAKHCGAGANESRDMYVRADVREHHAWTTSEHVKTTDGGVTTESCTSSYRVRVGGTVREDAGECLVEPVYPTDLLLP